MNLGWGSEKSGQPINSLRVQAQLEPAEYPLTESKTVAKAVLQVEIQRTREAGRKAHNVCDQGSSLVPSWSSRNVHISLE